MAFTELPLKPDFYFRAEEIKKIRQLADNPGAQILTIYGRRRVGKSELVAQALAKREVLKIEGVQGLKKTEQLNRALKQLARAIGDPDIGRIKLETWYDFFDLLTRKIDFSLSVVLYFEELQWLANYSSEFISDLKYFWDNHLQYSKSLLLILCGSSPSFMLEHVINSAALHNRSQHQIHLAPFRLVETIEYLDKDSSQFPLLDAFLTVGGIPEYLNYFKQESSILLGLCKNSFLKDSFFSNEYQRVFVSSLRDNPHYQTIISFLAHNRFADRAQILNHLKRSSGGDISDLMTDLELSGFIQTYGTYSNPQSKKLVRYQISDPYLQFYYKFIKPKEADIQANIFVRDPMRALNSTQYTTWLGFQFERWCRLRHDLFSKIMGFSSVSYEHGPIFSRKLNEKYPGYQWDFVFNRKDKVITLCEIKYLRTPASTKVAEEFQSKLEKLPEKITKGKTIEKALIAPLGASEQLQNLGFFDIIVTLEDIINVDG